MEFPKKFVEETKGLAVRADIVRQTDSNARTSMELSFWGLTIGQLEVSAGRFPVAGLTAFGLSLSHSTGEIFCDVASSYGHRLGTLTTKLHR